MTAESEDLEARLNALEREVASLREELATLANRDIPLLKGTFRAIMDGEIESMDELPDAGQTFNQRIGRQSERLEQVENRLAQLGTIGQEQTTKEEKFAAILTFAQNKRNGSAKVSLTPHEIRGCAGVSRRYAYELIETMATAFDGVSVREPTRIRTANGVKQQQKALLIDCERVRAEIGRVNQFTTQEVEEGSK